VALNGFGSGTTATWTTVT